MPENFTLLLLSQHYPNPQQIQILSCEDVSADVDVASFLQQAEQQVSQNTLDGVYAYAAEIVAGK